MAHPVSSDYDLSASTNQANSLGDLLPQPVYQILRNYFLRPHDTVYVTDYFFREWFPRLGSLRWLLILTLRASLNPADQTSLIRVTREELAAHLGCSEKAVTDLLRHIPHPTRKGWRALDPNGPDGKPDPQREAAALFLPRLRYWYEKDSHSDAPPKRKGFIIAVSMDDPLTPEDETRIRALSLDEISAIVAGDPATPHVGPSEPIETPERKFDLSGKPLSDPQNRAHQPAVPERENFPSGPTLKGNADLSGAPLKGRIDFSETFPERKNFPLGSVPEGKNDLSGGSLKGRFFLSESLKGKNVPYMLTLTKLTKYIEEDLNETFTATADIRWAVAPLVQAAEEALADFHSTGMFYKVLCALYPDQLNLFVEAMREALGEGVLDEQANLGAVFVGSIKALARQAGVDLGFGGLEAGVSEVSPAEGVLFEPGRSQEPEPVPINGWTGTELWQQALSVLQLQMPRSTFEMWLLGSRAVDWDGDCLVVELRNPQAREWVASRMHAKVVRALRGVAGRDAQVEYTCRPVA
jgi:hypothetical protein